mgnify:CR=1 FL=1
MADLGRALHVERAGRGAPFVLVHGYLGGSAQWAAELEAFGAHLDVIAVDLPSSAYARERVFEVQDYDGHTLPVPTRQVDVLFSSNVLEHVPVLAPLLAETRRVLATDGVAIHILPTSAWRTWTTLTHFPWVIKRALQTMLGRRGRGAAGVGRGECSAVDRLFGLWPRRHGERGKDPPHSIHLQPSLKLPMSITA